MLARTVRRDQRGGVEGGVGRGCSRRWSSWMRAGDGCGRRRAPQRRVRARGLVLPGPSESLQNQRLRTKAMMEPAACRCLALSGGGARCSNSSRGIGSTTASGATARFGSAPAVTAARSTADPGVRRWLVRRRFAGRAGATSKAAVEPTATPPAKLPTASASARK